MATTSPRGREGKMTFSLQRLPEPLILEQDTIDPKWNKFKTYFGVWVGGLCFMAWVVYLSFTLGASAASTRNSIPMVVAPQTATAPQPQVRQAPPVLQQPQPAPSKDDNPWDDPRNR